MQPSDFKRKYRFKSSNSNDRWSYTIAIVISIIAFLVIWLCF
ncbi:hypothetical protein SAMN03003324_03142 [Pedobacter antarcticus]|uniref:Uncharacterized protein n=1 Tax=Pedobacter antarcticus TaxID=34086 RepID=A0A1I2HIY5_9SPHI|nr:hypothetical protein SAMN03003324_03142 [Pedobacter antarcticus]